MSNTPFLTLDTLDLKKKISQQKYTHITYDKKWVKTENVFDKIA